MDALNAAQRMQMIEKFETLTIKEYGELVSENEQLRQRVAELESLLKEAYADSDEVLRPRVAELEKERDKATQYWQIAEGRCDALKQQRDELLAAAEAIEIDAEECLDFDECTAMLVQIDDYHKLMEAIASVKEKQNEN